MFYPAVTLLISLFASKSDELNVMTAASGTQSPIGCVEIVSRAGTRFLTNVCSGIINVVRWDEGKCLPGCFEHIEGHGSIRLDEDSRTDRFLPCTLQSCLIIAFPVCLISTSALSADCNFDKPIGNCIPSIELKNSTGSHRSYSANVMVHSSAKTCSKVEYYVDTTPYVTVLSAADEEPESLFASSPIKESSIEIRRCTAFADRDIEASLTDKQGDMVEDQKLVGTWIISSVQDLGSFGRYPSKATFVIRPDLTASMTLDNQCFSKETGASPDHHEGAYRCVRSGSTLACHSDSVSSNCMGINDSHPSNWTFKIEGDHLVLGSAEASKQ